MVRQSISHFRMHINTHVLYFTWKWYSYIGWMENTHYTQYYCYNQRTSSRSGNNAWKEEMKKVQLLQSNHKTITSNAFVREALWEADCTYSYHFLKPVKQPSGCRGINRSPLRQRPKPNSRKNQTKSPPLTSHSPFQYPWCKSSMRQLSVHWLLLI